MSQEYTYEQLYNMINDFRINEAERILNNIISTEPQAYMAYLLLGYIRKFQGEMEQAKGLFLKSLDINPNFEQGKQFLSKLNQSITSSQSFVPDPNAIYAFWCHQLSNWGDAINEVLIQQISGKKVIWSATFDYNVPTKYLAVGSILRQLDANTVVWGAGSTSENAVPAVKPKKVCAVRGPLSRQFLISRGIDCPEIYGDPALLYPRYYNPEVKKQYDLGIIPHYVDQQHSWLKYAEDKGVKIINIEGGINHVIDEIKSCDRIASSSLHGIIAADSYGIPSAWIEFSNKVLGDGFKFRDYYQSINRPAPVPLQITMGTSINQLDDVFNVHGIDIDLDLLFDSCPFRNS